MYTGHPQEIRDRAVQDFKDRGCQMWVIADRYDVSREGLRRWCNLDPEIIAFKKEAMELRSSGMGCKEISNKLKDKYFHAEYRLIVSWTQGCGQETKRSNHASYHENKARPVWDLLKAWKRPVIQDKYYRFPPCAP